MLPMHYKSPVRAWKPGRCAGRAPLYAALSVALGTLVPVLATAQKAAPRVPLPIRPMITTHHNDNQHTGVNNAETAFIPTGPQANLTPQNFGKIWSRPVDGTIYTQPLYVPSVPFPNAPDLITNQPNSGVYNAVYVCTTHNSIYAFDAGGSAQIKNPNSKSTTVRTAPLWKVNFNFPNADIGPVPTDDLQSDDLTPEVGIVGTPVIDTQVDPATGYVKGTMYVVVKTKEGVTSYAQRLHALDICTGRERLEMGSPVLISASVPGNGDGSIQDDQGNSVVNFDPLMHNQQGAITLVNAGTPSATLYIAFGSHGNVTPYHGWVMAFNASNLQMTGVFNTSPNGDSTTVPYPAGAGVWQSGVGPAIDENGNVYVATGVGVFNADPINFTGGTEYGNSVLKLQFPGTVQPSKSGGIKANLGTRLSTRAIAQATVLDYFTPFNWEDLSNAGSDLGSGGLVILPDVGNATYPRLAASAGIEGKIYLLNRDSLGEFTFGSDSVVQELPDAVGPVYGAPAFFNNTLYYQGTGDVLKAFQFQDGFLNPTPVSQSTTKFGFPGATPVITTDPTGNNAIVWSLERMSIPSMILDPTFNFPAPAPKSVLHAYNANDVSNELFNAVMCGTRDASGNSAVFTPPTVANGRVYVAGENRLTAFGFFAGNGVKPKPTEADHFIVTGPVSSGLFPSFPFAFPGFLVTQTIGYWYSVTAIGPDGNPIKLSSTVHLATRSFNNGGLQTIGNLNFNDPVKGPQSNVVFNYAFPKNGIYDFYVSDDDGHNTLVENFDLQPVASLEPNIGAGFTEPSGVDHFVLKAPATAKTGSQATLNITAVSKTGTPYPILVTSPGVVICFDTLPDGTQGADPNAPGFAYDTNQPSALFFKIINGVATPVATSNLKVTVRGVGNHVFIVTSGITGTAAIKGVP